MSNDLNTELPHGGQTKFSHKTYSGKRLVVEVEVRANVYGPGVMLLDGRAYPAGKHNVQILAEDLAAMEALVETEEYIMEQASERHELKLAEYINKTRGRDGKEGRNTRQTYDGSVEIEFLDIARRPYKPLLSCKVVSKLDTLGNEERVEQTKMLNSIKSSGPDGQLELMAEMLKTIKSLNAKVEKLEKK